MDSFWIWKYITWFEIIRENELWICLSTQSPSILGSKHMETLGLHQEKKTKHIQWLIEEQQDG